MEPEHSPNLIMSDIESSQELSLSDLLSKIPQSEIPLIPEILHKILEHLISTEKDNILSFKSISSDLQKSIAFLHKNGVLVESECESMFGGDWNNRNSFENDNEKIMSLIDQEDKCLTEIFANGKYEELLVSMKGFLDLYQVYDKEYKKIAKNMLRMNIIEIGGLKYHLGLEEKEKKEDEHCFTGEHLIVYKEYDNQTYGSLLIDPEEIATSKDKKEDLREKIPESPAVDKMKGQSINQIIEELRKILFKPIINITEYLQYITKYSSLLLKIFKNKINSLSIQDKEIIAKSKACLNSLLYFINKLLYIEEEVESHEEELISALRNEFLEVFLTKEELQFGIKEKEKENNKICTSIIINFNTFEIEYLSQPCHVYLVRNHVLIIEKLPYVPQTSASRLKTSTAKIIIKRLACIEIDYTSRIEIVSNEMLYHGSVIYISGGKNSEGIYLRVKGRRKEPVNLEELINKHRVKVNCEGCENCSEDIVKWQKNNAKVGMNMIKMVMELKISCYLFQQVCDIWGSKPEDKEVKINEGSGSIEIQRITSETPIEMRHITPNSKKNIFPNPLNPETYYNFDFKTMIPQHHILQFEIISVEYRLKEQEKHFVAQISLFNYGKDFEDQNLLAKELDMSCMALNYERVTETIFISETKVQQILELAFNLFPQILRTKEVKKENVTTMRFQEWRQLIRKATDENEQIIEKECFIYNEMFNTIFKSNVFRIKPEFILMKLGISEGFWRLIIHGTQEVLGTNKQENNGQEKKSKNRKCSLVCKEKGYWQWLKNEIKTSEEEKIGGSKSILDLFFFERAYLKNLHFSYLKELQESRTNNKASCSILTHHFNKIQYVKYLSSAYSPFTSQNNSKIKHSLLNIVPSTQNFKSVEVLIYALPNLEDYFEELDKNEPEKKSPKKTNKKEEDQTFTDKMKQDIEESPFIKSNENHGFVIKKVEKVTKDMTATHLKYLLGKLLGIKEQYISHFLSTFVFVIVEKEKISANFVSKIFSFKKHEESISYQLQEAYTIHSFERVYDILNHLEKLKSQSGKEFLISLKKKIKLEPPPILKTSSAAELPEILENYEKILELEAAEIWYKINREKIQLEEESSYGLINICLLTLLFMKYNKKRISQRKEPRKSPFPIIERLLIKTGIFPKKAFENYYTFSNDQETNVKNIEKKEIFDKIIDEKILQGGSIAMLTNSFIVLVNSQSDWDLMSEPILYIKDLQKREFNSNLFIFINHEGIIIREGVQENEKKLENVKKSRVGTKKSIETEEDLPIEFVYEEIEVELFGSVVTIISKNNVNSLKKFSFFCVSPFLVYEMIVFYKKWSEKNIVENLSITKSKFKEKERKLKEENLEKKSRKKTESKISSHYSEIKSHLEDQFITVIK